MKPLPIVDRSTDWTCLPGSVAAADYLAARGSVPAQVVNLCRCDRYQDTAYYVSLLAAARDHHPLPDVSTLAALQGDSALTPELRARLEPLIIAPAAPGATRHVDVWFGRDPAGVETAFAAHLFEHVRAPLLRATLHETDARWQLQALEMSDVADLDDARRSQLAAVYAAWSGVRPANVASARLRSRPAVAILHDPDGSEAPSNPAALTRFVDAAHRIGLDADIIDRHAGDRLQEYDALFIRDTTHVAHYTYALARQATALGLVVIDDPESILKCTNKVYLHELMSRHGVPVPRTLIADATTLDAIAPTLGLPCILKQPDSAFSLGVRKVETIDELVARAHELLEHSAYIVAQEFLPTTFDWRVGVLDGRPLFVCQYFMAPGHWQVIKRDTGNRVEGRTLAMAVSEAPRVVIETAVRAAGLIGDGLYGVDVKQVGDACHLIEVNDNPNVDHGNEDSVLGDALYREVMGVFARRIREQPGR